MNEKIIVYGAGHYGRRCIKLAKQYGIEVLGVADRSLEMTGKDIEGYIVWETERIRNQKAVIVISVADGWRDIKKELAERYSIREEYLVSFDEYWSKRLREVLMSDEELFDSVFRRAQKEDPTKRKIVLTSSQNEAFGGIETWLVKTAQFLKGVGYDVSVILLDSYDLIFSENVHVIRVNMEYKKRKKERIARYNIDTTRKLIKKLTELAPCVMINSRIDAFIDAAYFINAILPDRICIQNVLHGGRSEYLQRAADISLQVDGYIGVSKEWICKRMVEQYGIAEERVTYFTLPVEYEQSLTRSYSSIDEPIKIGFASRMTLNDPDKRVDYLIPLIRLLEKAGTEYILSIAGDGDYLDTLSEWVAKEHLSDRVLIKGRIPQKDMTEFWREQDIHISLSDSEGNSVTKLEAMAVGTVPIITDVSGARDAVDDGKNGFVVACGDIAAFAEKIRVLSKDRDLLKQFGYESYKKIKEEYSEEATLARLKDMRCFRISFGEAGD